MIFISKDTFEYEIQKRVNKALQDKVLEMIEKAYVDKMAEILEKKAQERIDWLLSKLPEHLIKEAVDEIKRQSDQAYRDLYRAAEEAKESEFGSFYKNSKGEYIHEPWYEQYPFKDTIGSELFLDMLVKRINKKQVHPGL